MRAAARRPGGSGAKGARSSARRRGRSADASRCARSSARRRGRSGAGAETEEAAGAPPRLTAPRAPEAPEATEVEDTGSVMGGAATGGVASEAERGGVAPAAGEPAGPARDPGAGAGTLGHSELALRWFGRGRSGGEICRRRGRRGGCPNDRRSREASRARRGTRGAVRCAEEEFPEGNSRRRRSRHEGCPNDRGVLSPVRGSALSRG